MTALEEELPAELRADWVAICELRRLTPDRGVAALVDGRQVAIFLLSSGELHAVDNIDPCSGAAVLSRGLIGDADGIVTVASPLYKHRFDLATGRCLDAEVAPLDVHMVEVVDGVVVVRLTCRVTEVAAGLPETE